MFFYSPIVTNCRFSADLDMLLTSFVTLRHRYFLMLYTKTCSIHHEVSENNSLFVPLTVFLIQLKSLLQIQTSGPKTEPVEKSQCPAGANLHTDILSVMHFALKQNNFVSWSTLAAKLNKPVIMTQQTPLFISLYCLVYSCQPELSVADGSVPDLEWDIPGWFKSLWEWSLTATSWI